MKSPVTGLIVGDLATEIDSPLSPAGSDHEKMGCVVVMDAPGVGETGVGAAPTEAATTADAATAVAISLLSIFMYYASAARTLAPSLERATAALLDRDGLREIPWLNRRKSDSLTRRTFDGEDHSTVTVFARFRG